MSEQGKIVLYDPIRDGEAPDPRIGDFNRKLTLKSGKPYVEFIFSPKAAIPVGWLLSIEANPVDVAALTDSADQSTLSYAIVYTADKSNADVQEQLCTGGELPFSIRGERIEIPANGFSIAISGLNVVANKDIRLLSQIVSISKGQGNPRPIPMKVQKSTDAPGFTILPNFSKRFRLTPPSGSATPPAVVIAFKDETGDTKAAYDAINGTLEGYIPPNATRAVLTGAGVPAGGLFVEFELF